MELIHQAAGCLFASSMPICIAERTGTRYTFVPGRKTGITTLLLKEINNNGKKLSLTYDAVGNIVV